MTKHLSFKDFFDSEEVRPLLPEKKKEIIVMSIAEAAPFLAGLGASKSKQDEFAQEVSDLSVSESFISEFSDKLGTPTPGESEEAFVRRAKTVLREALRARFRNQ